MLIYVDVKSLSCCLTVELIRRKQMRLRDCWLEDVWECLISSRLSAMFGASWDHLGRVFGMITPLEIASWINAALRSWSCLSTWTRWSKQAQICALKMLLFGTVELLERPEHESLKWTKQQLSRAEIYLSRNMYAQRPSPTRLHPPTGALPGNSMAFYGSLMLFVSEW